MKNQENAIEYRQSVSPEFGYDVPFIVKGTHVIRKEPYVQKYINEWSDEKNE